MRMQSQLTPPAPAEGWVWGFFSEPRVEEDAEQYQSPDNWRSDQFLEETERREPSEHAQDSRPQPKTHARPDPKPALTLESAARRCRYAREKGLITARAR